MQRTLMLIKPDAVAAKSCGGIIGMVEAKGFQIVAARIFQFDAALCKEFYQDHLHKEFYPRLEAFMCSGSSWGLILERQDAVCALRELMGDVMPEKRVEGTIRYHYGHGITDNGVHGSDSVENAKREMGIVFMMNDE